MPGPGLPPHPPPFHPASPSLKSLHKFYSPAASCTSLPSTPIITSPIVAPTPVYPASIISPIATVPHGGYFAVDDANTQHVRLAGDPHARQHNPAPGTPHTNKGELSRAGAVPLSPDRGGQNHASAYSDTLRPAHPLSGSPSHVVHLIPSPLYDSDPATIHYARAFTSVVPADGPNGGAALVEVPGLMPDAPVTRHMKYRSDACFSGMNGTITYVFQAHEHMRVEREVNLTDSISLRMSTVAEGACSHIRGFYRNHRELGVNPERVVPLGLVKKKGGKYVVVAGVVA